MGADTEKHSPYNSSSTLPGNWLEMWTPSLCFRPTDQSPRPALEIQTSTIMEHMMRGVKTCRNQGGRQETLGNNMTVSSRKERLPS